jgi:sec-independent protein translocase protein TatB
MFDIGWMELLVIGVVALIVVGPKDLPKLFRNVGQFMGKARGMAREFQRSMEQAADESGLKEAARDLQSVNRNLKTPTTGSARKYAETLVKGADKAKAGGAEAGKPADTAASKPSVKAKPAPETEAGGPDAAAAPSAQEPAAPPAEAEGGPARP